MKKRGSKQRVAALQGYIIKWKLNSYSCYSLSITRIMLIWWSQIFIAFGYIQANVKVT